MRFSRFFSGFISVFLIFTITFQVVAFPFSQPKKAEASAVDAMLKDFVGDAATGLLSCAATWGISFAINAVMGLTTDVPSTDKNAISLFIQENCLKPMAKQIALGVLQKLTESTVAWINGGFNGNPFYVRDLGSYLTSVTDETVKSISYDIKIGNSPYAVNLSAGIINGYLRVNQNLPPEYNLDRFVGAQAQAFTDGQFREGGWDAWLASSIIPQNNLIGASLLATDYTNKALLEKKEENKADLAQNDGFLSMKKCLEKKDTEDGEICTKYETATPGSMISDQLKETGKTSKDQLLSTDDLMESFMSIFSALLTSITTDGVSSLGSSSGQNDFGGYGTNDLTTSTTPAGVGNDWTNAGGSGNNIDLDNLQAYKDLMQQIIDQTNILIPKMDNVLKAIYEADYCVPGPNANWYDRAQERMRSLLDGDGDVPFGDTVGQVMDFFAGVFRYFWPQPAGTGLDFPGYGDNARKVTQRALDGWEQPDYPYNVMGYKQFIEKYYSMVDNIPVAFSVNKEYQEVDDYEILIDYNKKRAEQAQVYIQRLEFLSRIYDGLPPTTDPLYAEKRAKLQEDANSILAGIYTNRTLEGIESQIIDMDAKYLYVTNTDISIAPLGLIPQCVEELNTYTVPQLHTTPLPGYPPTNKVPKNRRPYPERLLPLSIQANYPSDNVFTFLPFVKLGPMQDWPVPDGTTPTDQFYWDYLYFKDYYSGLPSLTIPGVGTIDAAEDPRYFEYALDIY